MQIHIILFGQLSEAMGVDSFSMADVTDTDQLSEQLKKQYPLLNDLPYVIAVEKEIVTANTQLSDNNTVALLPPYAGG